MAWENEDRFLLVFTLVVAVLLTGIIALTSRVDAHEKDLDWPALLIALERVEAPATPEQAQRAIEREGAYGPLQIRQPALDDVNRQCGTDVKLAEVATSRNLSRWVCVQYIRMHVRQLTYEHAARTWNGGPSGPKKKATQDYWQKVREALQEQGIDP